MYTHIGAMRMPLRNNPLVEGVNTEAARVVTQTNTYMYVQDNYSNPHTCGPMVVHQ